jgi:hypothetical protein
MMTRAPRHVPRSPTEELLDPTWNEGIMMTMDDPIPLTVDRCRELPLYLPPVIFQ